MPPYLSTLSDLAEPWQYEFVTGIDSRIDLACTWFSANIAEGGLGKYGWGWVPDVPPNPQNTAEVVCALTAVGRAIPHRAGVEALVRSNAVEQSQRGDWAFDALVDVAWRLRALRCLGTTSDDPDLLACVTALVAAQDPTSGGWRLAGRRGPVSTTATSSAVRALLDLEVPGLDLIAVRRAAISMLTEFVLDGDERTRPLYAAAQVAHLLSSGLIAELGGARVEKARDQALERVMSHLNRKVFAIEEEVFRRGSVTDIWRHTTLPMSLGAVAFAAPDRILEVPFRSGLVDMLGLQETGPTNVNRGGFRTSREGFVTSYATTQSLEVLAQVRTSINERMSPAKTFDFICRAEGAHHTDPQELLRMRRTSVTMNSSAGAIMLVFGLLTGATIIALSVAFRDNLGTTASRALVVWGTLPPAIATAAFTCVRLNSVSNRKIVAAVFAAFTALLLPVVTFLLA